MNPRIYTIGHSRHPTERLVELLRSRQVARLLDVRRIPFSRRNPQFSRDRLADDLARHQIAYRHLEDLGGLRDAPMQAGGAADAAWRKTFLRSYAEHARTRPFRDALDTVCHVAQSQTCAIMCAEADWRQCHRQIIADYLIVRGLEVLHILADGGVEPAVLSPSASPASDGTLHYARPEPPQLTLDL